MVAKVLTARAVAVAKPKRNAAGKLVRNEIPDGGCPGLYLVVEPTGTRSWAHRYRHRGVSKKRTLGSAAEGGLSLAAARHAVAAARHRLGRGGDPTTAPHPVAPVAVATKDSVEAAVASFLDLHAYRKTRLNSAKATEYSFNRFVLPAWRGRRVADINRRDVIDLIDSVAVNTPYAANRLLAALSKFFNWLCARDAIPMSPAAGVERPHREVARQRTLDDGELRALWRACEGEGTFGAALRMLVLTGCRRNEVSQMKWSEIDDKRQLWLLPAERTKSDRAHVVPLSSQAWAILQSLPQINGSDLVFTTDGRGPIIGWAKVKARISHKAGLDAKSWRLHDTRRSCASGMQRLGVPVPVVEKALNHASGIFRGIVAVYQTHDYADDMRIAFQKWGDHVEQLVTGKTAKVVKFRKR
jgi:integrase